MVADNESPEGNAEPLAALVPGTPVKTVGQIAYEAYCGATGWRSAITGVPLPQYADQQPAVKQAWEAAGNAARLYHTPEM